MLAVWFVRIVRLRARERILKDENLLDFNNPPEAYDRSHPSIAGTTNNHANINVQNLQVNIFGMSQNNDTDSMQSFDPMQRLAKSLNPMQRP